METQGIVVDREVAKRVLAVVDKGLCKGQGVPEPGKMCIEAAVCYAMGLPHGDNPSCVGSAVRSFKIRLNDSNWSSNEARAAGMRRVAIAQLGSDKIDQHAFANEVTLQVTKQLLPIALRAAGSLIPAYCEALEGAALACETISQFSEVRAVTQRARELTQTAYATYAAADAAATYATYAAAAYAADAAAADDYDYAAYAAADDYDYADAAADAAAYAAAYAAAARQARDGTLSRAAEIGVQALIKLGAQGCEWLDLCDEV